MGTMPPANDRRRQLRRRVARAICQWRADANMTIRTLGYHVGVCDRTVKRWESGQTEPNATDIILMEDASPGIAQAIFSAKA